jgi:TatD DNase family protein
MNFPEDFFLDFHAHQRIPAEKEIVIQSLFLQNDLITNISDKIFFTAGLHPWHADQLSTEELKTRLEQFINSKSIIAVGEAGLDKLKGPDLDVQIEVFKQHIEIAEKYSLPLIIHSVKAHNEILKLKIESKSKVPWVIHHFNGGKQIASDFIKQGFYLSVSKHINNEKSRINHYFGELPIEKIFLETDDFNIDIKYLYEYAARKFNMSIEDFKKQLIKNLKSLLNE